MPHPVLPWGCAEFLEDCDKDEWKEWNEDYCRKTCGYCTEIGGNECAKIPSWMKPALDVNSRIFGGSIAESPIPWQVRLHGGFNCGGTILDEYTILTAAHCKITSNSYGYAGHTSYVEGSGPKPQEFSVKKVINKNGMRFKNGDYSIVKLKQPLIFNSYVHCSTSLSSNSKFCTRRCCYSQWMGQISSL